MEYLNGAVDDSEAPELNKGELREGVAEREEKEGIDTRQGV